MAIVKVARLEVSKKTTAFGIVTLSTLTPIWISVWRFRKSEIDQWTAANAVGPDETGEPVEHKP